MIRYAALCLVLALSAAPAWAQDAKDRQIVPGLRVGAITAKTSWGDLRKIYGRDARVGTIKTGEGDFYGAELFANKPDYLRVYATEDKKRISLVEILAEKSPWRTADGIGIGTPLADVVKANGGPVTMAHYEGEGGGYRISNARGGKLHKNLTLHFFADGELPEDTTKRLGTEAGVPSDDPSIVKAKLFVYRITVDFGAR
jgi:hypothetical protein